MHLKKLILLLIILATDGIALNISFFEEFPNAESMEKLKHLKFETKVYIAATSFHEFEALARSFKVKTVYWPVLEAEEGYWISPWADANALERIFKEAENRSRLEVMLDLEPSLNRWRLLDFKDFSANKKRIKEFINYNNNNIVTVEKSYLPDFLLRWLGLSYGTPKIKMVYTSFARQMFPDWLVERYFKSRASGRIGIGTIATGIHGNEPILSPEELERELIIANNSGVQEVVIFRLGGLNEEYAEVINKWA